MREHYIDSCAAVDELGKYQQFDYYLLVGETDVGPFFCESYGVKIVQRDTENQRAVPNVTTSAARIDGLLELLVTSCVTPRSLPDVMADWL